MPKCFSCRLRINSTFLPLIRQITHEEDKCGRIASSSNPFTDYETPQFHKYSCKLANDIIIVVDTDSDCRRLRASCHCGTCYTWRIIPFLATAAPLSPSPSPLVCFLFLLIHIRMSAPFPLPILARTEEQEDRQIASQSESPLVQRDHDIFSLPSLPHFNFPLFLSSLFFTPSIPPSVLSTHQFGPPQQWWLEITTERAVHVLFVK